MGRTRSVMTLIALTVCGCTEAPDIEPMAPPGAYIPKVSPDADPAQAIGEQVPVANKSASSEKKSQDTKPAPPTAKGQVKTTAGGVKYETVTSGTGPELKSGQTAQFHYVGKLLDGEVFDSSRSKTPSKPLEVAIGTGAMIKGWDEALPGMKVGEVRKLIIPSSLAYGKSGRQPKIPPDSTLVFEVELVNIK